MAPLSQPRRARRAREGDQPSAPRREPRGGLVVALVALATVLAAQYGDALSVAFINDDFVFLDKTRAASFAALWEPRGLAFYWYRPLSREFHYWALQRVFGFHEPGFHAVSFALWLGLMLAYFALVRRLAGTAAAAVATAGMAALACWGLPLIWVAGVQELWMLLFALLALHAFVAGRRALATAACAAALLSKETAAVLPALATAWAGIGERRGPLAALRRAAPLWALVGVWALFHPVLGGRLWHARPAAEEEVAAVDHPPLLEIAARAALVPLNLDDLPRPERGFAAALARGVVPALALLLLAGWGLRAGRAARAAARAGPGGSRVAVFGLAWLALGCAPLLLPSLGWHAYSALLGAGGAWLALGVLLARRPAAALLAVGCVALLRPARADTVSRDWGSEWYQRRADAFLRHMRADLQRQVPQPPHHSRFYFIRVPSNVGFLAGDGPALRVWYGDSTLSGGYYRSYRLRAAAEPPAPDYFFRYDSTAGWAPVVPGAEDAAAARAANPRYEIDHRTLAETLAGAGDWPRAASEYAKLAEAFPDSFVHAYNAGVSFETLGDSAAAAAWYARAAERAGADAEVREAAARLRRHLRAPPQPAR